MATTVTERRPDATAGTDAIYRSLFDRVDPDRLGLDQARTDASPRVTHLTYTAVKR